jgi:signal transduction histidine kinase
MDDQLRVLGRVTAGVAHDLSNYLAVIEIALAALDRRDHEPAVARAVQHAHEATEQAVALTRCLIEYARGGHPPSASVDLGARVRHVLDVFRSVLPVGVEVVFRSDADARVTGVAAELEQLVLNLVLNACDAMRAGGTLDVRVRANSLAVSLEVADTGGGLSPVIGDVQGDSSLSPSTKASRCGGAGLGLGIVRRVAESHGASLHISPRPDGGTSCLVIFPAAGRTS